jgi:CubicO group peptidase (beta-lactamase class C family)
MIDEYIRTQMETYSIPGLSVAVVRDDISILIKGYG